MLPYPHQRCRTFANRVLRGTDGGAVKVHDARAWDGTVRSDRPRTMTMRPHRFDDSPEPRRDACRQLIDGRGRRSARPRRRRPDLPVNDDVCRLPVGVQLVPAEVANVIDLADAGPAR